MERRFQEPSILMDKSVLIEFSAIALDLMANWFMQLRDIERPDFGCAPSMWFM